MHWLINDLLNGSVCEFLVFIVYTSNEGSYEPEHSLSLIRAVIDQHSGHSNTIGLIENAYLNEPILRFSH